jgi:hypothetical protein
MRQFLAWLSFIVFVLGGSLAGPLIAAGILRRVFPGMRGSFSATSLEALIAIIGILVSIVVAVYVSALLWMVAASLVFTRDEARQIVFYGKTFRLERWLFGQLFPLHRRRSGRRSGEQGR